MKAGISTAALFPQKSTEEAAAIIKQLSPPVIEVRFSTFYEYRPEFSKALAPALEPVEVNSVCAEPANFEGNLFSDSRRVRGDGLYWLDQLARSANLLSCNDYFFRGFMRGAAGHKDDFAVIGSRIAEAYGFLQGYGVNICLENSACHAYAYPGFFSAVRQYCPNLFGVFNIDAARRSGYPYQMYLKELAGSIACVRLSDVDDLGNACLPGTGNYDFKEILQSLKDVGFGGNIIIGNHRADFKDVSELKLSLEFLNEICYKLG